ncbi:MAG: carboxypeptidase-like regulatory domain-containing protein, partial [Pseudonocardiales bacterium]
LSAPACPGPERVGRPCPPWPVHGAVVVAVIAEKTVASARTHADGTFLLSLPEGRYLIRATNAGGYAPTARTTVRVGVARPVSITLTVDSGMR